MSKSRSPLGVEELLQQILGLTAERTRIADEEAQQAQQQYQQAEQAPPEQANPLVSSIATAGARLGTVLAGPGGPDYSKQLKSETASKDAIASKARLDNVTRLRTTYEKAAERAAKAGDSEAEVKARVALKKIDEQAAKDKAASDEIRWRAEQDYKAGIDEKQATTKFGRDQTLEGIRSTNRVDLKQTPGALAEGGADVATEVSGILAAVQRGDYDIRTVETRSGLRGKVMAEAARRGETILPKNVRDAVNEVGNAMRAVDEIEMWSNKINTESGLTARATGLSKKATAMAGMNLPASMLDTARKGLVGNLSRAVAAEKGVLTQPDIDRALTLMPALGSTKAEAAEKLRLLREFLDKKIANAKRAYAVKDAGLGGGAAAPAGPAPSMPTYDLDAAGNVVRVK